jgi:hypothetical protein
MNTTEINSRPAPATAAVDAASVFLGGIWKFLQLQICNWEHSSQASNRIASSVSRPVHSLTGAMVWRGMASGDVDANASPKKHDKKIHEVVQKIFRSYPPKE